MKNRRPWKICFAVYCALMLWLLFDRSGGDGSISYWDRVSRNLNLQPFHTIGNYWHILANKEYYLDKWEAYAIYRAYARTAVINLVGNVVMFIPLGFLLPKVFSRQNRLWKVLLTTAVTITLVELAQLFTLTGSCDVDDLILNLAGAAMGYGLCKAIRKR